MVDAVLPGNLDGVICTAIVNHQVFNLTNARKLFWQRLYGLGKGLRFVVAWDLDDQLHVWKYTIDKTSISQRTAGSGGSHCG